MADADKILVRSNGTVTYTGKDIAYQLWKLGLLRDPDGATHDFGYRAFDRFAQAGPAAPVRYGDGDARALPDHLRPGRASGRSGVRRRLAGLQRHRRAPGLPPEGGQGGDPRPRPPRGGRELDPLRLRDGGAHAGRRAAPRGVAAASTSASVRRTWQSRSSRCPGGAGSASRPTRSSSPSIREAENGDRRAPGRRGRAAAERSPAAPAPSRSGALRYQMARQGRNRVLAFDFDEALAFEGDTGPYLQYSAVRAGKIFEKLAAPGAGRLAAEDARAAAAAAIPDDLWELVLACARTPEMVEKAVASLEFSLLAGHARDLAQSFHKLYHEHPVLHAEDDGDARAAARRVPRVRRPRSRRSWRSCSASRSRRRCRRAGQGQGRAPENEATADCADRVHERMHVSGVRARCVPPGARDRGRRDRRRGRAAVRGTGGHDPLPRGRRAAGGPRHDRRDRRR